MKQIGKIFSAPFKALGLIPKTPKLPAPTPTPTRDAARELAAQEDKYSKRRGGAADILSGSAGVEADLGARGKDTLGVGGQYK